MPKGDYGKAVDLIAALGAVNQEIERENEMRSRRGMSLQGQIEL
jgi:hypothetical protein